MLSRAMIKDKAYFALGLITFLVLSLLAGYFYRERIAFLDAAYQLFMVVYKGDFATFLKRREVRRQRRDGLDIGVEGAP